MTPRRYSFDGEMTTPAELARRITCYSEPWLGEALKAGCRSVMDLSVRYAAGKTRERAAGNRGSKLTKLRGFDIRRRLKPASK